MRIAYLDCFSGISGDMFLGALVDAGVSPGLLEKTVTALRLGARLEISRVSRNGIAATKVDVWVGDEKDRPRTDLSHGHQHGQHHHHEHEHHDAGAAGPHRGLKEIREIITRAPLDDSAKGTALAIFEALGAAEAKIHGIELERVHFHEVGAVDAIVDIVCAAVGSRALGVAEWICSPLNVGSGTIDCAHGHFPVPAPATAELLKDAPIFSSGIEAELVTPTGAAIVKVLARRFAQVPPMKIKNIGYGAGSRDFAQHANVLRVLVGEKVEVEKQHASLHEGSQQETISVLEANLDDLNPQVFGYVLDRLLADGALDVFATPVQMKKNRPGLLLTVLAKPEDAPRLSQVIFAETTTLGIRMREERRQTLLRKSVAVQTPWGAVRMKVASLNGTVANYAPEYEDCRRIAEQHRVPLKQVMQEALRVYLQRQNA
jgi:hypothetical protein